jgi:hypothetical protein
MKLINGKTLSLLLMILVFGCGNNGNSSFEMTEEKLMASQNEKQPNVVVERQLIKEGRIEFETNDINLTRNQIFKSIEKHNGYTSSDKEYKYDGRKSNTIIIRVPAKSFDLLLSEATLGVAKFDSKNIEIKDVTEEFLDIQARLKTKKELENRYIEILKKANSVTELLEVEKQIGQLRSEIESIEGRLNYLKNKISLSTLTITFYEMTPNETAFGNKFKNGFKNGWENLIWFFVYLTNIWPFILIAIGLLFGINKWGGKKKKS